MASLAYHDAMREFVRDKLRYVRVSDLPETDRDCPICFCQYSVGQVRSSTRNERPIRTPCGHVLGENCFHSHLRGEHARNRQCPVCRTVLFEPPTSHLDDSDHAHAPPLFALPLDRDVGEVESHEVREAFAELDGLVIAYDDALRNARYSRDFIKEARDRRHELLQARLGSLTTEQNKDAVEFETEVVQVGMKGLRDDEEAVELAVEKLFVWVSEHEGIRGFDVVTKSGFETALFHVGVRDDVLFGLVDAWTIRRWSRNPVVNFSPV